MYSEDFSTFCDSTYECFTDDDGSYCISDPSAVMSDIEAFACEKRPVIKSESDADTVSVTAFVVKTKETDGVRQLLADENGRLLTCFYRLMIPVEVRTDRSVFMDEYEGDYEKVMAHLNEVSVELDRTRASYQALLAENERLLAENESLRQNAGRITPSSTGSAGSSGGSGSGTYGSSGSSSSGGGGGGGGSATGKKGGSAIAGAATTEKASAVYENYARLVKKNQKLTKKIKKLKKKNSLLKDAVTRLKQQKTDLKNAIKEWKRH